MIHKDVYHKVFFRVRVEYWVCLLLVVATLSVYWPVRDFEFVNYDDPLYVAENRYVQKGLTLETVKWSFTEATRKTNYWVPLTWLSILLDYELYGMNAGGYHLTNVFFHVLNTLLVFIVLRRLTGALWPSAFVAALFGLHPLHVESVAWVTERKDVLSTMFWLLTLLSYGGYVRRPGAGRYFLTLLLFILGMMSKPMLVTLPFVLLLLDYWPLGRLELGGGLLNLPRPAAVWKLVWEKGPFFIIVGIAGVAAFVTQQEAGAVKTLAAIPLAVRIPNVLVAYVSYIGKMFWPLRLSFLYPHPGALPVWQWSGALLILAAITYGALRHAAGRPYLAVGWLWYLGTLFPVSGIIVIGPHAVADRYTYVPLLGLYLMLSWGVADAAARWRYKTAGLGLTAAVILALLAGAADRQVRYWQNSVTLMEHALEVDADSFIAHNLLGNALEAQGRIDEAARHYFRALRINPKNAETYNNIGYVYYRQGRTAEALNHFLEALRIDPNLKEVHYNLGSVLTDIGRFDDAIKHFLEALRIDPTCAQAHNNLGIALVKSGQADRAMVHFQKAIVITPDYAAAHYNLGMLLIRRGKIDGGIHHLREALRIAPDHADAGNNLNWVLGVQRKLDNAVAGMDVALLIEPGSSDFKENLTRIDNSKKRLEAAINQFQKGLISLPGFTPDELNMENYQKVSRVIRKYKLVWPLAEKLAEPGADSIKPYYYGACLYALQSRVKESVSWLEKAVRGGFTDWNRLRTDPNLENIRATAFYQELMRNR